MMHWFDGPLAALDTQTTGPDAEEDRIVSAALVLQDAAGGRFRVTRWLVSPGIPVPGRATEVHGLTDDHLQRNGRWPAPVMEELGRALAEQCVTRRPVVVTDAPFGLTLLDRELRRHRASSLAGYLGDTPLCVLDPRVLDRHLDRHREGPRALGDLCALYGVELESAHDAAADAAAALELVRAMGHRYAARLERLSPPELHSLQEEWHAAQARGPQAWFDTGGGSPQPVDPAWPLRPALPAAA
ncbi:exonuclease domain-containing protein [Streptomyces halstedii]|uniref:exonuclease domain-containing protein n=1 Tax=Streptomyces TaxID=1883 RepID=UPI00048B180B|nr:MULTISPECIES: exonuclease domain-containing protein [Streptomyces]WSX39219.1 exonuclease domain-containing protein [Streptomyces halstedii]KDQ66125.1 DNA polymerase III subunit epsilon [Streptomyces sp. NTK 937]MCW8218848.1 3'-5' exonuclease [Streptomyces griseolus]MYR76586.1 3'-5' exonuclease [Streptomyces sp. SID4925]MYY19429.1 3'-5' exonuclease [Streptomyces sp. SID4912]